MVLLVADTQKIIANNEIYRFDKFVANVKKLLEVARKKGIEVVYIRHDDGAGHELTKGTPGYEIYEEFSPHENEKIFDKSVNSPFKESGLLQYLKEKQEKQIIVVGLQTDYCIDATIKCGFEHDFEVLVPEYTNSTLDNEFMSAEETYRYYNDFIWNNRYARCISMQETLDLMETIK